MGSSSSRNVEASQASHRSRRERGHASDACFFNRRHNSENRSGHGHYQENRLDEASASRWESRMSSGEQTQFQSGNPAVPVQISAEGSQLLQGSDGSSRSENRRITGGVILERVDNYISNTVESESRANALLVENCQSTRSSFSLESKVSEGDDIETEEECDDAIAKETRSSDAQRKVERAAVENGSKSIVEVSTPWSSTLRGDIAACSSAECATTSSSSEAESHLSEDDAFTFTTPSSYQDNIETTDQSSHLAEESPARVRADTSSRESRRNSGRRFWDALTRAASHRRTSTPITIVAIEEIDDHGSATSRWNLQQWRGFPDADQSGGFSSARTVDLEERRRHVRSQVWALQRLSGGLQVSHGHARSCPAAGHHPSGPCSCETHTITEDSSTRASISRIIMLAEALFEVLDEIHRQSVALSRTMPLSSLPAPDAVVDSIPIRLYKKFEVHTEPCEEAAQCYICLIEYEEGDQIRVLPCHHEYHKACVDKWLKEVHRVCPLCRGDVCESESNTGNAEIPSL